MPVRLTSPEALRIFDLADIWAARTRSTVRLVSANDHVHERGSAHYAGLAVDLHSSNPDGLARFLGESGYRVLWKVPGHHAHVHAEVSAAVVATPVPSEAAAGIGTPRR
jgi:hypothetical protein